MCNSISTKIYSKNPIAYNYYSFNFTAINIYVDKEYTGFYFTVISFQEEWLKFDQVLLVLSNSTKPM